MMDRHLATLEYDKIIDQLASHTAFSASRELALELTPTWFEDDVRRRLAETTEAKEFLAVHPDVSIGGARDVRHLADRASLGSRLQPPEILDIWSTLLSSRRMRYRLLRVSDQHPTLAEYAAVIVPLSGVIDEIQRCLDEDGRVLDSASPSLARIRREAQIARDRLVTRLQRIVASEDTSRYLQEPIVTERNRRYVLPLKVEFKGRIPGIIHDQSASGATLFIEPLATVDLNNRWQELQLEERREIDRILDGLSALVGAESDAIANNVAMLALIDMALAKAKYSYELKARAPDIGPAAWPIAEADDELEPWQHPVHLIDARHPLLPREGVVPIDIHLGGTFTALIVTGPNTGGKTVSLKTMGLMAAMAQAGLHIPVADGSKLPVFDGIYADIGDEQSIEQSLSTFSSHMTHIIDILDRADHGSLVLLDELGAGTDPVEGAALGQAIVTSLVQRGSLAMCSSHYSQLKVFAYETPRVENASVEFDVESLAPTFRLVIGLPGQSNAFAIAKRLGLQESVIAAARSHVPSANLQTETMLANIKLASVAAETALSDAEKRLTRARAHEEDLARKLAAIEDARRVVLNQAREEGRQELARARSLVERIQSALASQGSEAETMEGIAQAIESLEDELAPLDSTPPAPARVPEGMRAGDTVRVTTLDQTGELISLEQGEAEVRVGGFRLRTEPSVLEFVARAEAKAPERASSAPGRPSPGIEIDLRGQRADEAQSAVERYLDNAAMAGLPWVHIIHGKGTGVLKSVVRGMLAESRLVESYRPGDLNEGGDGITVVQLHALGD